MARILSIQLFHGKASSPAQLKRKTPEYAITNISCLTFLASAHPRSPFIYLQTLHTTFRRNPLDSLLACSCHSCGHLFFHHAQSFLCLRQLLLQSARHFVSSLLQLRLLFSFLFPFRCSRLVIGGWCARFRPRGVQRFRTVTGLSL